VQSFSKAVKEGIGTELMRVQYGEEPIDWRPMKTVGAGVSEIRVQEAGHWRVFYIAKFEEGIYVLHAFRKTTRQTARSDIELGRVRLSELVRQRRNG
jgi:phage-related protein